MDSAQTKIMVKIPNKVFFSKDPINYTVKNDFHITIYKSNSASSESAGKSRKRGEDYPKIYIKGFEHLFDESEGLDNKLTSFFKMFNTQGNNNWSISYGQFRETDEKCAVIVYSGDGSSKNDFPIGIQLSDKCVFDNRLDVSSPISLCVYIDDFNTVFPDVKDQDSYTLILERGFAVYIEKFGAYKENGYKEPVTAIHKGEKCQISWEIAEKEKASAFLYDEKGAIIANLPPYSVKIDKDRKFTLVAYNDYCSVTQTIVVHRTLWNQTKYVVNDFPKIDSKGHLKAYRDANTYYLYIHPTLYSSKDFLSWEVFSEKIPLQEEFSFYSSSFYSLSFGDAKIGVCYLSNDKFFYYEMRLKEKNGS